MEEALPQASEWLGSLIILLPIILLGISLLVIWWATPKSFLRESLLESGEMVTIPTKPKDQDGKAVTKIETVSKRSASRLILFLSGITSLTLAACITSFYFYMNIYCIDCEHALGLDDFTNILLALGIGVVPYATNQVKKGISAIASSREE